MSHPILEQCLNIPHWCPEPFSSVSVSVDGDYSTCCVARDLPFTIHDATFEEYFNHDIMRQFRAEMLSPTPGPIINRYCSKCHDLEMCHNTSRRLKVRADVIDYIQNKPNFAAGLAHTIGKATRGESLSLNELSIATLDLKIFGNKCNQFCIMCHPDSSNLVAMDMQRLGYFDGPIDLNPYADLTERNRNRFHADVETILPRTEVIRITGGEPMINSEITEFLQRITTTRDTLPQIHMTTNGMHLNPKTIQELHKFANIKLSVSIDGYAEINDMQRRGSSFSVIDKNLHSYINAYALTPYLVTTVTPLNCSRLEDLQIYSSVTLKKNICISCCLKPYEFSILYLPEEIREQYHTKLSRSIYRDVFKPVLNMLESGTYDEQIFDRYLVRVIEAYGKEKILRYFPEYKQYVV